MLVMTRRGVQRSAKEEEEEDNAGDEKKKRRRKIGVRRGVQKEQLTKILQDF